MNFAPFKIFMFRGGVANEEKIGMSWGRGFDGRI